MQQMTAQSTFGRICSGRGKPEIYPWGYWKELKDETIKYNKSNSKKKSSAKMKETKQKNK